MAIEGGCFCRKIRYEIDDGSYVAANCHCTMCRRTSAAPFVSWLVVPEGEFRYVAGTPKLLTSSDKAKRWFCEDCGTPIACVANAQTDVIDVTIGSLDKPDAFPPKLQVWSDTRLPWITDPLPEHDVSGH